MPDHHDFKLTNAETVSLAGEAKKITLKHKKAEKLEANQAKLG